MTPEEAARELEKAVKFYKDDTIRQRDSKLARGANALRNAELSVLRGNPSPSAPGSPPGTVSGTLMRSWSAYSSSGGTTGVFGIIAGAHYAGYLEDGTSKMAPRPYVERIQEKAIPDIIRIFSEIGG